MYVQLFQVQLYCVGVIFRYIVCYDNATILLPKIPNDFLQKKGYVIKLKTIFVGLQLDRKHMDELLISIKKQINDGDVCGAIGQLQELLASSSGASSDAYYLLGNAYRKQGDWQGALNNYQEAIAIDPDSPAAEARNILLVILNFYNKDMFNQ